MRTPIPKRMLSIASMNILSKGDPKTRILLFDIHRSYGGDDKQFCRWCALAERFGLVGPALYRRFEELGKSICELLVYVIHRQLHELDDPVAIATGLVSIATIRERVTW